MMSRGSIGWKDLSAYDLRKDKKETANGISTDNSKERSVASASGNSVVIADLIDFVNIYTGKTINVDGKEWVVFKDKEFKYK